MATAEALDDRRRASLNTARGVTAMAHDRAPRDLAGSLGSVSTGSILVDCLTLWLSNQFPREPTTRLRSIALKRRWRVAGLVLVANEVGLGIVPDNALARRFRDLQGRLNQRIAARADQVVLMVAGLPLIVKGIP